MKNLCLVLVAIFLVTSVASAQDIWGQGKMSAGVTAQLALPMGTFGDSYGIGFGGAGLFQYGITPDMLLTGQVGYISFSAKNSGWPTMGDFGILAGAKYNLSGQAQPGLYVLGQIGFASVSVSGTFMGYSYSASETDLAFAPGVGYQIGNIDLSVKYLIISTTGSSSSALSLDVAYVFPL
jgi:hypothetical protein